MKKETSMNFITGIFFLAVFTVWTVLVRFIDVQPIGPDGSSVGFAAANGFVHSLTGVHLALYTVTDWLGLVPIAFAFGFAVLGLIQWIKRKHIFQVDFSILVLGGFYIVTMAVYILFEMFVINYRPVLINGYLEASYPSSTTTLVMCVMPTAIMQFNRRIKRKAVRRCISLAISAFIAFMVIGRFLSGVHWLTDIIGGIFLSAGLVKIYSAVSSIRE